MLLYVEPSEMISVQLNIIMVSILAAKRREAYRLGLIKTLSSYKSLRWVREDSKTLRFTWVIRGKRTRIQGRMDYALWYGSRANVETNLVVVQAKEFYHASSCVPQVITYMGMQVSSPRSGSLINYSSDSSPRPQTGRPLQLANIWPSHGFLVLVFSPFGP
jgi:hypothetical protein